MGQSASRAESGIFVGRLERRRSSRDWPACRARHAIYLVGDAASSPQTRSPPFWRRAHAPLLYRLHKNTNTPTKRGHGTESSPLPKPLGGVQTEGPVAEIHTSGR
ncbi:hypothetical protein NDU88_000655 [Pleurodeles waltl]|uniref:Uncharacterized protein n=1 Tax=Pleurodeles waltl TaxID=8319 RepID=A0AAV7KMN0_PLEWA|nr:hypothetical protein NDU88_000655 [Pleurodeles waltl]